MGNKVKILDCTLRDGGYYNDWDFEPKLVMELVASLTRAGIDIIELGYRSPVEEHYGGLFKYCVESMIRPLLCAEHPELGFMIDAKEFLKEGRVDWPLLDRTIPVREGSIFTWIRVATYAESLDEALEIATHLSGAGYKVGLNLMSVSLIPRPSLGGLVQKAKGAPIEVLYFADSFGSFTQTDIRDISGILRSNFGGFIGFHAHDNLGLAFSNSLAAMDSGVDFIDCTVAGMGRGVGNLRTEQLAMFLYHKAGRTDLDPSALLEISSTGLRGLKDLYQWGWDLSYMLSGLQNLHPTYCQRLRGAHQYTMNQVTEVLDSIPVESRSKFNKMVLLEAVAKVVKAPSAVSGEMVRVQAVDLPVGVREVLVVARGSYAHGHLAALGTFIRERAPLVIECNDTGFLSGIPRVMAVLNPVRLHEVVHGNLDEAVGQIIVGFPDVVVDDCLDRVKCFNCRLQADTFAVEECGAVIPNYLAGSLALAIALALRPETIYLAGFDGFTGGDNPEHEAMVALLAFARMTASQQSCRIVSLTRTGYPVETSSIYALLNKKD